MSLISVVGGQGKDRIHISQMFPYTFCKGIRWCFEILFNSCSKDEMYTVDVSVNVYYDTMVKGLPNKQDQQLTSQHFRYVVYTTFMKFNVTL